MPLRKYQEEWLTADKTKYTSYSAFALSFQPLYARKLRLHNKQKVLDHYGRICNCCGETEEKFLTIDHVNNDGHLERKGRGGQSDNIIFHIVRDNFPPSYQILCMNCNLGKSRNDGTCPHKNKN